MSWGRWGPKWIYWCDESVSWEFLPRVKTSKRHPRWKEMNKAFYKGWGNPVYPLQWESK